MAERTAEPEVYDDETNDDELFDVGSAFGEEGTETSEGDEVADPKGETPEPPAKPDSDQPRDEQGRFKPKGDQPDGEKSEEAATPAADAPQEDEAGTPTATPAEPAAAPDEGAEPATLRFTANRQEYEIPGSRVTDDGVFIPKDALDGTVRLLAHGRVYADRWREIEQERRTLQRELEETRTRTSESETKFNAVMQKLESMRGDEEAISSFFEDTFQNWDRMLLDAEKAALEAEKQRLQAPEPREEDLLFEATRLLPSELESVARGVDELKHLTREQIAQLAADFEEMDLLDKVFLLAEEDDPAGRWRKGQLVFHEPRAAYLLSRFAPKPQAQPDREKAAAANARLEGRSGSTSKPSQSKPKPAPSGASEVPLLPAIGDYAAKKRWDELPVSLQEKSIEQNRRAAKGKWSWEGAGE